jgi:hypothetical protein
MTKSVVPQLIGYNEDSWLMIIENLKVQWI